MYTVVQRSNDLVNTAELQHYFQGLKQIFDNPEYRRQFQEYQKNINEIEKKQLLSGNTCTLGKLKYDQDRLPNISPIAMKNLLMNRSYVPNFAYVFGGFKCSAPILQDPKYILGSAGRYPVNWCNSGLDIEYIIYENIAPAVSFKEYVKKCTFEQFLDKYLQIIYALII